LLLTTTTLPGLLTKTSWFVTVSQTIRLIRLSTVKSKSQVGATNCSAYAKRNEKNVFPYSPPIVTKLPAEPWRQEERCVCAGENESPRRLSSAVSPVYSTRSNKHFDTTGSQRSFVHSTTMSLLYRVPAAFAPRGSEPARHGARRLSPIEMSGTKTLLDTRKRSRFSMRMPHVTFVDLYTV